MIPDLPHLVLNSLSGDLTLILIQQAMTSFVPGKPQHTPCPAANIIHYTLPDPFEG